MEDHETKYLFSPHWREFRESVLKSQRERLGRNICERCPKDTNEKAENDLQVHHLTYESVSVRSARRTWKSFAENATTKFICAIPRVERNIVLRDTKDSTVTLA